jgi:hypothetical protein
MYLASGVHMTRHEKDLRASPLGASSMASLSGVESGSLFVASRSLTLLDHFRIPYRVDPALAADGIEQLRLDSGRPSLFWTTRSDTLPAAATVLGADRQTEVPLFASILADSVVEPMLADRGEGWSRVRRLGGLDGGTLGSIWRSEAGDVFLPFDPDEAIINCWSERYLPIRGRAGQRRLKLGLMRGYYRVRPMLPRPLQIWLRRHYAAVQGRSQFPRWPIETCLHDFFELALAILASISGAPVPAIAPWPDGFQWAFVLSHDVEAAAGWDAIDPVLELERSHGVRSAWHLVPKGLYRVDEERVDALTQEGFEVGVHGLHHDGRDLASLPVWCERLPEMLSAAKRWGAVGFRAPAMHRNWEWMPMLELDYDSSTPDTDPFEPQAGGCCTWLPFFNASIVELPPTLTQDHTLFVILRGDGGAAWSEKAQFLRSRGGMALLVTHPDYLLAGHILAAYGRFLQEFAADPTAWKVLPREVSAWWRRRAASTLELRDGAWEIVGPASGEGTIEYVGGAW